jgi:hypothetical protein
LNALPIALFYDVTNRKNRDLFKTTQEKAGDPAPLFASRVPAKADENVWRETFLASAPPVPQRRAQMAILS